MKTIGNRTKSAFTCKPILLGSCLLLAALPNTSRAGIQYWDNNGASTPNSGVWDNSTKNWASTSTLTASTFVWTNNNLAVFTAGATTAGTVTLTVNAAIGFGGLDNNGVGGTGCNLTVVNGGSGSLTLASGVQGFYVSSGFSTTWNMPISGPGGMEPQGSGSLYLNSPNSFTNAFIFDGTGLVYITNGNVFGTGPISVAASGGALVNNGAAAILITNTFTGGTFNLNIVPNTAGLTFSGPWTLGATSPLIGTGSTAGNVLAISGAIGGTGGLNAYNLGILNLSGVNTYSGPTSNSCAVIISGAGVLNNGSYAGKITNNASITYNSSASQILSGVMSGTGSLIQMGSGPLTLSGVNTFTGTVSNGASLTIGGAGTLVATTKITNNGTFTYNSSAAQTLSGVISGTGTLTQKGAGALSLTGTANTYSGATAINGGYLYINADASLGAAPGSVVANQLTINSGTGNAAAGLRFNANTVTLNANRGITLGSSGGTIGVPANDTDIVAGVITGNGNLQSAFNFNTSLGTLKLTGANTYTGTTTVAGGTLQLGASGTLPSGTPVILCPDNTAGGVLDLNTFNQTIGTLATAAGVGGAGTATPSIKLSGALTILQTNVNTTFAGIINGAGGSLTLNVPVGGMASALMLTGTNTYSGATTINAATLALVTKGAISNTATLSIGAGGTFDVSALTATTFNLSSATTLSASGTSTPATINGAVGGTVNLEAQPISLTYDGVDPSLTVSQSALILNSNAITVTGSALAPGTYPLISVTSGSVMVNGTVTVSGSAIGAGTAGSVSVSGGTLNLVILPIPTFSSLTASQPITYGTSAVTLSGTVSGAGPTYPALGETVTVTVNGVAQMTTTYDSTGDFTLTYNTATLPVSAAYPISYSYSGDAMLASVSDSTTTLTVSQAPLTITANAQSGTYGQPIAFGSGSTLFTASGLSNSETIGTVTLTSGAVSGSPIGAYTITPSAATGGSGTEADYAITYVANTLTITPLAAVLTGTESYDGTTNVASAVLSVSNAIAGDNVTLSGNAVMASHDIGVNPIVSLDTLALTGTAASNYSLTVPTGAVTVTPLAVELTGTRMYDGTNDASASILSVVTNYDSTNLTVSGSAVLAGSTGGVQSISDFTGLTLGGSAATNYTLTNATGSVTITAATTAFSGLTASQSIIYGTPTVTLGGTVSAAGPLYPPAGETITVTINGNAQTTTINDSTGDFSLSYNSSTLPATTGNSPGNFSVRQNSAVLPPSADTITYAYAGDLSFTNASDTSTTLTVTPLPVILTGAEPYNGTPTAAFGYLSVANTINSDVVTVASGTADLAGSDVGAEAIISPGSLTLGGANAGNYTLTGASGSVTVGSVPLSITANAQSTAYGALITLAASTQFTSSGLQSGDTIGSVTLAVAGYSANTSIGSYTLTPSAATDGTFNPANYSPITYNASTLTVTPLAILLTGTEVYNGTTNVASSNLLVTNVVGGDDVTLASGSAGISSADIGTNAITSVTNLVLAGTTASNYTLSGASGIVTVTPLAVELTGTRPYDGTATITSANLTVSNAVNGDDVSIASGSATLAGSAAGTEAITDASGLVLGGVTATNYTLTAATGSVTVTPAALSITANPVSKTYGTAITLDPTAFTVGSGLVSPETVTAVTMTANAGTAATDPVSGSPYTITPSAATGANGFLAANYNITYNTGALMVNPLPVVLTGSRPYDGTATAPFGILSVADAVGSDDVNVASGSATLASATVGTEAITSFATLALGGTTAGNYTLTGATGSVTIVNPYNSFSITSESVDGTGTNLVVCFQSVPGVVYSVLTNGCLASPSWGVTGGPITATNTTTCVTLPEGATTNVYVLIKQ